MILSYKFVADRCCEEFFNVVVRLISCLSFPCSFDNDWSSLLMWCNDWPITSSLNRTPLLFGFRWRFDEDEVERRELVVPCSWSKSNLTNKTKFSSQKKKKIFLRESLIDEKFWFVVPLFRNYKKNNDLFCFSSFNWKWNFPTVSNKDPAAGCWICFNNSKFCCACLKFVSVFWINEKEKEFCF